jgi:fatty-acid peroxygenase
MFYQPDRFTRKKALPPTTLMLLQDYGSVQLQDADAHRRRKQLFVSLADPARVRELIMLAHSCWRGRASEWAGENAIVLLDEAEQVLCRAVCEWSGIRLSEPEANRRTRVFSHD